MFCRLVRGQEAVMNRQNQIATKQVMLVFDEFSSPVSLLVLLPAEGYEVILARNE